MSTPAPQGAPPQDLQLVLEQETVAPTPRVSVVVSLYNYAQYLESCLDSVKGQAGLDLDLVIAEDCSTDGSLEVARGWLQRHGDRFRRYRLLHHRRNQGLARTRNDAFNHTRTELVFVLDADNMLYPHCLDRLAQALEECSASFAYSYHEKFGEGTGLLNTKPWNPAKLHEKNTIDAMVLIRRALWESVGGYSTDMPVMGWEDFDLWFKIAKTGGWGILVPEILARYRVHRASMLKTTTNPGTHKLWPYLETRHPEFFRRQLR